MLGLSAYGKHATKWPDGWSGLTKMDK